MKGDWLRLSDYVISRRTQLDYTQEGLAEAAGINVKTIGRLERVEASVNNTTLGKIERALNWNPGSMRAILTGTEPTETEPSRAPNLRDDIERRLWALADLPEDERRALIHTHRTELTQRAAKRERSA